jgi:hypothetical protein
MLIFWYNFLCFFTVCLILMNLLLESSKHALFRLGCFFFRSLYITCVVLLFIGSLKLSSKFAYESFVWISLFLIWIFDSWLLLWSISRSWRVFTLDFVNNLCNLFIFFWFAWLWLFLGYLLLLLSYDRFLLLFLNQRGNCGNRWFLLGTLFLFYWWLI